MDPTELEKYLSNVPPEFTVQPSEESVPLTEEEKAAAREIFAGEAKDAQGNAITACVFCGGIHTRVVGLPADRQPCPRIRRLERSVDGTILVVEHWPPGEWERDVIFPHDVHDSEGEVAQ